MEVIKNTEMQSTEVVVGGTVTFSINDLRGLYKLTTLVEDEGERNLNNEQVRTLVRTIVKDLLLNNGPATDIKTLMSQCESLPQEYIDGKAMTEQSHADDRGYEE